MSNVQVRRRESVGFDEGAAGLDGVPHQDGEELVGFDGVLDPDLQEAARGGFIVVSQRVSGFISPRPL
jgi:hypothetical protein